MQIEDMEIATAPPPDEAVPNESLPPETVYEEETSEDVPEEPFTKEGTSPAMTETPSAESVSSNSAMESLMRSNEELLGMLKASQEYPESVSENSLPLYEDYDAFLSSSAIVDRYQFELLNRLEFIQYALLIVIALLFLTLFRKK